MKIILITIVILLIAWWLLGIVDAAEILLTASWYSRESLIKEGTWKNGIERRMANGKIFSDNNYTCATRLWPLGVVLRVTNCSNNKSVFVKVTDRISKRFTKTRIDLSRLAFSRIGKLEAGLVAVKVERIK